MHIWKPEADESGFFLACHPLDALRQTLAEPGAGWFSSDVYLGSFPWASCVSTFRAWDFRWALGSQLRSLLCALSTESFPIPYIKSLDPLGQEASGRLQSAEVFPVPMPPSTPRFLSEVTGQEGSVQLSWDCINHCEQRFGRQTAAVDFPLVCVHLPPCFTASIL